jgi:hypothetical protein
MDPKFDYSFEAWFDPWDQTGDPEVRRLCGIAWHASRAILSHPDNPDREKFRAMLNGGELKVVGGAPHGYGVWIGGVYIPVDVSEVNNVYIPVDVSEVNK